MAQKKAKNTTRKQKGSKVIVGRGDYDVVELVPKTAATIRDIDKRLSRLEGGGRKSSAFADVGSALGSAFGPLGSRLGGLAGSAIGSILGHGDYVVEKNSLMTGTGTPPGFKDSERWVTISHREFVGDVVAPGTTAFTTSYQLSVNPGLGSTFQWAAPIAQQYDQWEALGIVFCFESTSGNLTTSQALGNVSIASQYDPLDSPFSSEIEMLNSEFASSASPNCSFVHPIECAVKDTPVPLKYVRSGAVVAGDVRLYDLCRTTVAVTGVSAPAGSVLGKIWVVYQIKLGKPKLYGGLLAKGALFNEIVFLGASSNSYFGGSVGTSNSRNSLPVTYSNNTITFPNSISSGKFLISMELLGTSASLTVPAITYANCSLESTTGIGLNQENNGSTWIRYMLGVRINNPDPSSAASITWASGATVPVGAAASVLITLMSADA